MFGTYVRTYSIAASITLVGQRGKLTVNLPESVLRLLVSMSTAEVEGSEWRGCTYVCSCSHDNILTL